MTNDSRTPPPEDRPPGDPHGADPGPAAGEPPWEAIAAILSRHGGPAEDAALARWLAANPTHADELQRLTALWQQATQRAAVDVDAAWSRVSPRLTQHASGQPASPAAAAAARHLRLLATSGEHASRGARRATASRALRRWSVGGGLAAAAAAAVALLVVLGAPAPRELAMGAAADSASRWALARTYATERGQRARIQLADGSVVHLAPLSRITVAVDGDGTTPRDVRLTGAAVFDVATDSSRSFRVHAAGAVTRVLGTSFGVRAYEDDASLEVVVRSGRVAVRASQAAARDTGVVLTPGARARRANAANAAIHVDSVDASRALAWSEGRLAFARTPLREVARELERWRDVHITIADSAVAERRVTVDLTNTRLDDAVETLGILLDLPVRQEIVGSARHVYIGPPTAAASPAAGDRP